jgi:hypothetical protein
LLFFLQVIIAASAALSKEDLLIDWRPFSRDVFFYLICIVLLVIFSQPETVIIEGVARERGVIVWWEALVLIMWYVMYVAFMTKNEKFMAMMGGGNVVQPVTTGPSGISAVSEGKARPKQGIKQDKVVAFNNDVNEASDIPTEPSVYDELHTKAGVKSVGRSIADGAILSEEAAGAPVLEGGYEEVQKAAVDGIGAISAAEAVGAHPSPTGPRNAFSAEGAEEGGGEKGQSSCLDLVMGGLSSPWSLAFTVSIPVSTMPRHLFDLSYSCLGRIAAQTNGRSSMS